MFGMVAETATKRTLAIGSCTAMLVRFRLCPWAADHVVSIPMMLCRQESEHTSLISFMLLTILILEMVPVSNALPLFSLSK